jgi:Uma2 family endonuclease
MLIPAGNLQPEVIPPLENGDRLARDEFERRYEAMPAGKKAELIEGVVYMPSPVTLAEHGRPQFYLVGLMSQYCLSTPGVQGGDNTTVRLDLDNEPQPDIVLFIEPGRGGQLHPDTGRYVEGAPELVIEVAASSVSIDLHAKLNAYRRNGVCEYLVWRVLDRAIDWFVLRGGNYDRLPAGPDGVFHSEILQGLWFDAPAVLRGDWQAALRAVQQGLATPEHAAFVQRLQQHPKSGTP